MKILMVLEEDFPPDVRVENEQKILLKEGYEITLLCSSRKIKENETFWFNGAKIIRKHMSKLIYKLSALALMLPFYHKYWEKIINNVVVGEKFDVIYIHNLPLISVGVKIGRENNMKVVADLHENIPEIMKMYHYATTFPGNVIISLKKWHEYQIHYGKLVDKLILVTQEAKDYYAEHYGFDANKINVFPNFPDTEELIDVKTDDAILKKYNDKFMILYFGDTGVRRGTLTIIEAAKKLDKTGKYHFVIIGTTKEQIILENKIKEYGLTNVELTGYLPFNTIVSYIKAAKIGLCPFLRNIHHDTTFANKLFQIMFFHKPVIVSDCPSQEKVIREEKCGLVYKAGDPEALKEAIIEIDNPEKLHEFGLNAHKAVIRKYNNQSNQIELTGMFESLVEQNQK